MFDKINSQIDLFNKKPPIKIWWLLLLLVVVFIPHLYCTYGLMVNNQTHDLHLRILGTRLMEAGKNPYTYYWQVGDNMLWYDPNQSIYSSVNGVTTTPFFLWLQKPLLQLSYCQIRIVWWCIEAFFLFATVLLAVMVPTTRVKQLLVLLVTSIFFLFSRNWMMHVYNGQMYMLYAFVFMLSSYLLIKQQKNISLWLYPVLCLVRPFFVLSLLPFINLKRKTVWALALGGSIALALFFVAGHQRNWGQYKDAVKVYATEAVGGYDSVLRNKTARQGNFPTEDCLIKEKKADFLHAGCLYSLQSYLVKVGIKSSDINVFSIALLIAIAIIMLVVYQFKLGGSLEQKIVLSILLYFLAELFAPASRNPYNMVQWLPVVALLLTYANRLVVALLVIGLCLNHSFPIDFKYNKELGELLMFAAAWLFVLQPRNSVSISQSSALQQS